MITQFDNKHKGQRGFVIGGGPSILDIQSEGFDFNRLSNDITIGANKIYRLLIPTYLLAADDYFWRHFTSEVVGMECIKFSPKNAFDRLELGTLDNTIFPIINNKKQENTSTSSFSKPISLWNNTGLACLRIAALLGLNPIYIVGIDLTVKDRQGRTHFHNDYEPKRINKTREIRTGQWLDAFDNTIKNLNTMGIDIYSCSLTSKLNTIIPYIDIKDLF